MGEGVRRAASALELIMAQSVCRGIDYEAARSAHLWGLGCLLRFVFGLPVHGELPAPGPYVNVPGVGGSWACGVQPVTGDEGGVFVWGPGPRPSAVSGPGCVVCLWQFHK